MATTGPFEDNVWITGLSARKVWYRQTAPFKKPLYFRHSLYRGYWSDSVAGVTRVPATFEGVSPAFMLVDQMHDPFGSGFSVSSLNDSAYRKAYDSLVGKMKAEDGGASMGVTIAESKSSWTMIVDRLGRLTTFGRALKLGNQAMAIAALSLNKRNANKLKRSWPSRKEVANDFASSYLELIFGWMPLVKDIQDAINVLQNPPKISTVFGTGSMSLDYSAFQPLPGWAPPGAYFKVTTKHKLSRRVQCTVTIRNPNLDLANRLGFVNLPAIAWELVPGSFLLDWFIPVGRFLESWSDFLGREVSDPFMSVKVSSSWVRDSNYAGAAGRGLELSEDSGTGFYRLPLTSIPTPSRFGSFRLPTQGLQSRAITLFALFTQSFSK